MESGAANRQSRTRCRRPILRRPVQRRGDPSFADLPGALDARGSSRTPLPGLLVRFGGIGGLSDPHGVRRWWPGCAGYRADGLEPQHRDPAPSIPQRLRRHTSVPMSGLPEAAALPVSAWCELRPADRWVRLTVPGVRRTPVGVPRPVSKQSRAHRLRLDVEHLRTAGAAAGIASSVGSTGGLRSEAHRARAC